VRAVSWAKRAIKAESLFCRKKCVCRAKQRLDLAVLREDGSRN
jgi:hypothetical protein